MRRAIQFGLPLGLLLLIALAPAGAWAQRGARVRPPAMPRFPAPRAEVVKPPETQGAKAEGRPALGSGIEKLSQLPPDEREQALRNDPAFQKLPPARQKKALESLQRLNAMTPEQQQRTIQRMRDLGRLTPQQRQGLEQIFRQFQAMAPDRRRAFRAAYNNLRELSPEQREMRMSQPRFQQRFSPDEIQSLRQALSLDLPGDVVGSRPQ